MKKIISMLVALIIMIGIIPVFAEEGDEPSIWAKEEVQSAITKGYVPDRLQCRYQKPITREELAELLVTAIFTEVNTNYSYTNPVYKAVWEQDQLTLDYFLKSVTTTTQFTDTNSGYVKAANIMGIVNGISPSEFNPDGLITREQAAIMFMNYAQTVDYTDAEIPESQLEDLNDASPWAKEAVARSFYAEYIKGIKSAEYDELGNITQKAVFDTKGNITREQAIIIVSRLGAKGILRFLIIRGYVRVDMDMLALGIEVDNYIVKLKDGSYQNDYSTARNIWYSNTRLRPYYNEVSFREAAAWQIGSTGKIMFEETSIIGILDNQESEYDYSVYTVQHFKDGYLAIIAKVPEKGYFTFVGGNLYYGYSNQNIVEGIRRK